MGLEAADAFKASFLKTDADMAAAADVGYSGSTVAAAYIATAGGKRVLHTANCGDARIVLCQGGKVTSLSDDSGGGGLCLWASVVLTQSGVGAAHDDGP